MIVKKHLHQGRLILTLCDEDALGKVLEEGGLRLDLSSPYYQGEELSDEIAWALAKRAEMIECCGKRAVGLFLAHGMVEKGAVQEIGGVPHCLIYRI